MNFFLKKKWILSKMRLFLTFLNMHIFWTTINFVWNLSKYFKYICLSWRWGVRWKFKKLDEHICWQMLVYKIVGTVTRVFTIELFVSLDFVWQCLKQYFSKIFILVFWGVLNGRVGYRKIRAYSSFVKLFSVQDTIQPVFLPNSNNLDSYNH